MCVSIHSHEHTLRSLGKSEFCEHIKRNTIRDLQGSLKQKKCNGNPYKKEQFSDPNSDPNCHILRLFPPWKIHRIESKTQLYKHIERIWRVEINFSEFKSLLLHQEKLPKSYDFGAFSRFLSIFGNSEKAIDPNRDPNCFIRGAWEIFDTKSASAAGIVTGADICCTIVGNWLISLSVRRSAHKTVCSRSFRPKISAHKLCTLLLTEVFSFRTLHAKILW